MNKFELAGALLNLHCSELHLKRRNNNIFSSDEPKREKDII